MCGEGSTSLSHTHTHTHTHTLSLSLSTNFFYPLQAAGVANPLGPGGAAGSDVPRSLSHAFSRVASEGALCYGADEPMGAALRRFSQVQERVGNLHVQLDQDAVLKFHNPFLATLSITIGNAMVTIKNQWPRLQLIMRLLGKKF